MPIVTVRCVVLQTYSYGDTSKILRLMTRERGPRSAIARGALRPRSRFGGLIEPFAEGLATLYMRENRDLDTLSGFELIRERQGLGVDLMRFAGASVLCELVMRLAPEHPDELLFHTLVGGLDALLETTAGDAEAEALRRLWRLVGVLGYAPGLTCCISCGGDIPESGGARFDFASGGLQCGACGPGGGSVTVAELATLRDLTSGQASLPRVNGTQRRLLIDFIRYHLSEGVRIRSLDFLANAT